MQRSRGAEDQGGQGAGVSAEQEDQRVGVLRSRGAKEQGCLQSCSPWTGGVITRQEADAPVSPTLPVNRRPARAGRGLLEPSVLHFSST